MGMITCHELSSPLFASSFVWLVTKLGPETDIGMHTDLVFWILQHLSKWHCHPRGHCLFYLVTRSLIVGFQPWLTSASYTLKPSFSLGSCELETDGSHLLRGLSTDLDEIWHGQSVWVGGRYHKSGIWKFQLDATEIWICGLWGPVWPQRTEILPPNVRKN